MMHSAKPQPQQGAILPLLTVGMVILVAMVGLALDGGHMMLNKTRIQNTVDAAALSAAKTLDATQDEGLATNDAFAIIAANAAAAGNEEFWAAYDAGGITISVQFSSTLNPFIPGTAPAEYVRVRATDFDLPSWLLQVIGFNDKRVGATAVAGPSPTINNLCNLAPLMVCGSPGDGPPYYGYEEGQPDVLKTSAGGSSEIGPGNFQLVQLGGTGGDVVRENMAGSFSQCFDATDTITTEPGNTVGPVVQGFNTRFGEYLGPMGGMQGVYPPDVVVEASIPELNYDSDTDTITVGPNGPAVTTPDDLPFNYADYQGRYASHAYDYQPSPNGIGVYERRVISIPIGDCSATTNGSGQVPVIGFGCFFLVQPMTQKGIEAYIFGQFVEDCQSGGVPGPDSGVGPGPYIIQLYKDPDNVDS